MAKIDALLRRIPDPYLRTELTKAIAEVRRTKDFGLVFEPHLPETVRLPDLSVRRGLKVAIRGSDDRAIWLVDRILSETATLRPLRDAEGASCEDAGTEQYSVQDLVVVADVGDAIYPGLQRLGSMNRGGDKAAHIVINGENYHALEALQFTHAEKVDCIYIDPPYNTGAGDWKYSNDYVDSEDQYRHSKWLAFMERRLKLAKELLNPEWSTLVCTIGEGEVHRLRLLLEQIFPTSTVQMATIVINPSGAGGYGLNRVEEYAFFVWVGNATPALWDDNLLIDKEQDDSNPRIKGGLSWESLLRSGRKWYRQERENLCYPIKIDPESMSIVGVGPAFSGDDESARCAQLDGYPVAWPIRRNGRLGIWRTEPATLIDLVEHGYAYVSSFDRQRSTYALKYLLSGTINLIESGEVAVTRSGHRGQVEAAETTLIGKTAKTVWFRPSHNAGKHGSDGSGSV